MSETLADQENYFSLAAKGQLVGKVLGVAAPAWEISCKGFQFFFPKHLLNQMVVLGGVGLSLFLSFYFCGGPALWIVAVFQAVG